VPELPLLSGELGIHVCGGHGKHSGQTPHELVAIGERVGIDGTGLATASCLVAKVDSAAVPDGFDLYLQGFIVDRALRRNATWGLVCFPCATVDSF
jgi:hypothetical protein